ncbi:tetratricopeptide repeat protein [Aquabacterium sp. OR-4]|uniref:tetratricopeptide repeat protein n=1 Tax=Aquabacterium sp. OR-4 TaxID=2978127 RepID=UPI0021B347D9|nr:hypothetical protein [Aquabacterium sp. OR-4]MDT7837719.1 hypothetical protein [Aquabacterium sp. OR-4]
MSPRIASAGSGWPTPRPWASWPGRWLWLCLSRLSHGLVQVLALVPVPVLVLALGGCAAVPQALQAPPLAEARFAGPAQAPDAAAVMGLSPAMRSYLDHEFAARRVGRRGTVAELSQAMFARGALRLEYDTERTRTAAEAFDERAGNCLSLVLMAATLAQQLGLEVRFNEALVEAQWRREGDLVLRSGHVNLTLSPRERRDGWYSSSDGEAVTVDFMPPEQLRGMRLRPISQARVLAMFFNNRAAEQLATLSAAAGGSRPAGPDGAGGPAAAAAWPGPAAATPASGALAEAFWLVREALRLDPGFEAAHNTLGVVYQRAGFEALAGQVFEALLAQRPDDASVLGNLAMLRSGQGRLAEAAALRARRDALDAWVPGADRDRGMLALRRGQLDDARLLFEQEIARSGATPELQWWLAQVRWRQGQTRLAEQALQQALLLAERGQLPAPEQARYAGKLAWLKAQAQAQPGSAAAPTP